MKTYLILPTYCEGKVIKKVIKDIQKEGYKNIIVVDDGSIDNTCAWVKSESLLCAIPWNYGTNHIYLL